MDNFLSELFELVEKNATEGYSPPFAAQPWFSEHRKSLGSTWGEWKAVFHLFSGFIQHCTTMKLTPSVASRPMIL